MKKTVIFLSAMFTSAAAIAGGIYGSNIGQVLRWANDGASNPILPVGAISLNSGSAYKVNGYALDISDLTDINSLLGTSVLGTGDLSDWPVGVSVAELGYIGTARSDLQVQLDAINAGAISILASDPANPTAGTAWVNTTDDDLKIAAADGYRVYTGVFTAWDTTPDAFTFTDQTDVDLNSVRTSDAKTVAGTTYQTSIAVTGGTYDINSSGNFTATTGVISSGQTFRAQHTASATGATATNTTVTLGGTVADTFTSTTAGNSYADITLWLGFEAEFTASPYTLGADDYSSGDQTGTITGAATISATSPIIGTKSFVTVDAYDYMTFAVTNEDIVSGNIGRIGVYITPLTMVAQTPLWNIVGTDAAYILLQTYGTDELRIIWKDSVTTRYFATTDANLLYDGTSYFVEFKYDATANTLDLLVNGVNKMTSTVDAVAITPTSLQIGTSESPLGTNRFDNVMISSDKTRDFYGGGLYNDTTSPR